jgi:hypothetical protein
VRDCKKIRERSYSVSLDLKFRARIKVRVRVRIVVRILVRIGVRTKAKTDFKGLPDFPVSIKGLPQVNVIQP